MVIFDIQLYQGVKIVSAAQTMIINILNQGLRLLISFKLKYD